MDKYNDYFNIANYITVLLMYVKKYTEMKYRDYAPGHFGNAASINFIYSHLNDFYNKYSLTHQEVIGTGHSGVSLLTNLYLNKLLYKTYKKYDVDENGLNELLFDFGKIIRSEINPFYPNTIYTGGELGYSLALSYGYAISSNKDIVTCIIGDGECETGTLSSSWYLNKILKTKSKILPIINLNGYKMTSKSILSLMCREELHDYFKSLGYSPLLIKNDNIEMQEALNESLQIDNPLIILNSPKGWTGINNEFINIESSIISHKDPLRKLNKKEKEKTINDWLKSYNVNLFDEKFYGIISEFSSEIENYEPKTLFFEKEYYSKNSNMEALNKFLIENNIKVFSPDESISNKITTTNKIEMLSETTLNAVYQGYVNNNIGIYISYEAFMPIILSMVSQYLKYIRESRYYNKNVPSMTYVLTSTCYENTYSHQNPEFADDLLLKNSEFVNVYYPKDGYSLVECTKKSLNSNNLINVIISSKQNLKQYNTKYKDIEIVKEGIDGVLIATGDYMLENVMNISKLLEKENINMRIVYISYPKILSEINYDDYFMKNKPNIYCYHGYANAIRGLIYNNDYDIEVYGFNDKSFIPGTIFDKICMNGMNPKVLTKKVIK